MLKVTNKLLEFLNKKGLDAFFVNNPENIFYLTGYWSNEACLIFAKKNIYLFVSPLEIKNCEKLKKNLEIIEFNSKNFQIIIKKEKIKTLAYKKNHLTVSNFEKLQKITDKKIKLKGLENVFTPLRTQKTEQEIKKLKKSSQLADKVLEKTIPLIKIGVSEKKLAWKIEKIGRELGAKKTSFDLIVAFDKNTATPHHQASTKKLTKNTPILFDIGFSLDNYCSDITRCFYFGAPNEQWINTYKLVQKAQKESKKIIKNNLPCTEAHKKAVEIFDKQKKYFTHSLGHGIGIEVHELPRISDKSEDIFKNNMTFTVEPGLYFENNFGIRIEDTCLLQDKLITLNKFTKKIDDVVLN